MSQETHMLTLPKAMDRCSVDDCIYPCLQKLVLAYMPACYLLCALGRVGLSVVNDALCSQRLMRLFIPSNIMLMFKEMVFGTAHTLLTSQS